MAKRSGKADQGELFPHDAAKADGLTDEEVPPRILAGTARVEGQNTEVVRLYLKGETSFCIASQFGLSVSEVHRIVHSAGHDIRTATRGPSRASDFRLQRMDEVAAAKFPALAPVDAAKALREEICRRYLGGEPSRVLALSLGLSRKMILLELSQSGIVPSSANQEARYSSSKRATYQRAIREQRRQSNLCIRCGEPSLEGRPLCQRHANVEKARKKGARQRDKCWDCKNKPLPNKSHCQSCLDRIAAHRLSVRDARLDANLCTHCGKSSPAAGRVSCQECCNFFASRRRRQTQTYRESGACARCGDTQKLEHNERCEVCFFKEASNHHFATVAEGQTLSALFHDAGGRCPYTGVQLTIGLDAQLDHKVPVTLGGKTELANLQWVHKDVNQMKWNFTEEQFLEWVETIARHRRLAKKTPPVQKATA